MSGCCLRCLRSPYSARCLVHQWLHVHLGSEVNSPCLFRWKSGHSSTFPSLLAARGSVSGSPEEYRTIGRRLQENVCASSVIGSTVDRRTRVRPRGLYRTSHIFCERGRDLASGSPCSVSVLLEESFFGSSGRWLQENVFIQPRRPLKSFTHLSWWQVDLGSSPRCSHLEIGHYSCPWFLAVTCSVYLSPGEYVMVGFSGDDFQKMLHIPRFARYDSGYMYIRQSTEA